jgi:cytochrome c-type biogenesis protein CcmH/NrfF
VNARKRLRALQESYGHLLSAYVRLIEERDRLKVEVDRLRSDLRCDVCGGPAIVTSWVDVSTQLERRHVPGGFGCVDDCQRKDDR